MGEKVNAKPPFFHSTIRKVQQCQGFSEIPSRMRPAEKTAMSPLFSGGSFSLGRGRVPGGRGRIGDYGDTARRTRTQVAA